MKGRKQKISKTENYLQNGRTESESYAGVPTFTRITENNLTDNNEMAYGMLEFILLPSNLNASYNVHHIHLRNIQGGSNRNG